MAKNVRRNIGLKYKLEGWLEDGLKQLDPAHKGKRVSVETIVLSKTSLVVKFAVFAEPKFPSLSTTGRSLIGAKATSLQDVLHALGRAAIQELGKFLDTATPPLHAVAEGVSAAARWDVTRRLVRPKHSTRRFSYA